MRVTTVLCCSGVRMVVASTLLSGLLLVSPARTLASQAGVTVPIVTTPVPLSDLPTPTAPSISHLNSDTAHFITDTTNLVHVQLYNSPVATNPGSLDQDTWQFRSPALGTSGTTLVSTASLPFHLSVATAAPQADITSEDGVDMQLAVASVNGVMPSVQSGQVTGNTVTYPALVPTQPSISIQPTSATTAVQVTLPQAITSGSVALALTASTLQTGPLMRHVVGIDPAAPVQFAQQGDGSIVVQRAQQLCGSTGCQTVTAPELYVYPPQVHDSATDPLSASLAAPVTMQLLNQANGAAQVTVTVDPSWLTNPARVWPVRLTMQVVTAGSAVQTGVSGTLQSCAPAAPAFGTRIVVGTSGACTAQGLLYFPLSQLFPVTSNGYHLQSAILHLTTPTSTGMTGVVVEQNAPGALPLPPIQVTQPLTPTFPAPAPDPSTLRSAPVLTPPAIQTDRVQSWSTAPMTLTTGVPIAQATSAGQDQTWDITSLVQQWLAQNQTNSGVTLVQTGIGTTAVFATAGDIEGDSPSLAPYIDLVLAPTTAPSSSPSPSPSLSTSVTPTSSEPLASPNTSGGYSDLAATIWGTNGGSLDNWGANGTTVVSLDANAELTVTKNYLTNAALYRVPSAVTIPCGTTAFTTGTWLPDYQQMTAIYAAGLIPALTFSFNDSCYDPKNLQYIYWYAAMEYFSYYMPNFGCVKLIGVLNCTSNPPMYFEIGNEIDKLKNYGGTDPVSSLWVNRYPTTDFPNAAQGLYTYLQDWSTPQHPFYTNYHILTAGQDAPNDGECSGIDKANVMAKAEYGAAHNGSYYQVPASQLAAAIHPYGYQTNETETSYWRNMAAFYYTNTACSDLAQTISYWEQQQQSQLGSGYEYGVILTESNYRSDPGGLCDDNNLQTAYAGYLVGLEGSYELDQSTWMDEHYIAGETISTAPAGQAISSPASPVRMLWFRSSDSNPRPAPGSSCTPPPEAGRFMGLFTNRRYLNSSPYILSSPIYDMNHNVVVRMGCTVGVDATKMPASSAWSQPLWYIYTLNSGPCY